MGVCYPAGIIGPDDPGLSAMTAGLKSFMTSVFVLTSGGMQIVDVRDLAALLVTLLELPPGPHRYVAASPMLSWSLLYDLCCTLTGTHPRRMRVPGAVLRAAGSVGDVVKRLYDFDFPLTREAWTSPPDGPVPTPRPPPANWASRFATPPKRYATL